METQGVDEERRCVICGLRIRRDAVQCPYCGNILTCKRGPDKE